MPPASIYVPLLQGLVRNRDLVRAYFVFLEAVNAGLRVTKEVIDENAFNALAQISSSYPDTKALADLIETMELEGIPVHPLTLTSIAHSNAMQGDTEGCLRVVEEMQKMGGKGDAAFYNVVADTLHARGEIEGLDKLLELMKKDNVQWHMNTQTAFARDPSDLTASLRYIRETLNTLGAVIDPSLQSSLAGHFITWRKQVEKDGKTKRKLTDLVGFLRKVEKVETVLAEQMILVDTAFGSIRRGLQLFEELKNGGIQFSAEWRNEFVQETLKRRPTTQGEPQYSELSQSRESIFTQLVNEKAVSSATYNTLLDRLLEEGNLEACVLLVNQIHTLKMNLSSPTYLKMVGALFTQEKGKEAVELATYLAKRKRVDKELLIIVMKNADPAGCAAVVTCIRGKMEGDTLTQIVKEGAKRDRTVLLEVIRQFAVIGNSYQCLDMLREMQTQQIKLDSNSYSFILDSLRKAGNDKGAKLIESEFPAGIIKTQ